MANYLFYKFRCEEATAYSILKTKSRLIKSCSIVMVKNLLFLLLCRFFRK
jgi:hypothetical protein